MCRWALIVVVALVALMAQPALADRPVTVEQLQQMLVTQHGKGDASFAWQLADLRLTERLSDTQLHDLQETLPGTKSREALAALADTSAFLSPPASEIPRTPAPNLAEQRQIMARVVTYVTKTIQQLPNFFASRLTTHFEETPLLQLPGEVIPYRPLHEVQTSSDTVLYREGREVVEASAPESKSAQSVEHGLTSWGVFGPILTTVLLDAAQNQLAWSHWEQGANGPVAVFRYSVPKEKSHYQVNYCCVPNRSAYDAAPVPFRALPGYQGEITADPATGAILRLTLLADLSPTDPVTMANLMVEYGPVVIGNKTYICPLKSIALSKAEIVRKNPDFLMPIPDALRPHQTLLNEAAFEQYHIFRTDARILAWNQLPTTKTAKAQGDDSTSAKPPTTNSANAEARVPQTDTVPAVESATSGSHPDTIASAESGATRSGPAAATPPPAEPEMTVEDASELPQLPTPAPAPVTDTGFTLRTTTRLVDVGLVAYDKKGHPVTDLKPDDFEIYDNGQKQEIRFFSQAETTDAPSETPAAAPAAATAQPSVFTNRADMQQNLTREIRTQGNSTVVLMDASSLAWSDLTYARSEVLRFLKSLPADERVGLYAMRIDGFDVLQEPTVDHAVVATKLSGWMPDIRSLAEAQNAEQRNRQQMDYVHSIGDLLYVNGNNPTGESDAHWAVDPQLRKLGSNPEALALAVLRGIARHLATFAGHKSLVWISSDNVLADWSDNAPSVEKGDKFLGLLAMSAQEALNDAHVSIYPLDASQLEAGGVPASLEAANVQLTPTANPIAQLGMLPPGERQEAEEALAKSARDINPGRITATMKQDTHPIQGVFRDVATATGGRTFRRSGDIARELDHVVADGRAAYQLSFSPSMPADNKYHTLLVKLKGKQRITLRYRTGYFYDKEPASMKDRFREAVWQAKDSNEIGLTAVPVQDSGKWVLQLKINAKDLQMAQRGDRWMDKIFIFTVMRDDAVQRAEVSGKTLLMRLKPATYQKALSDGIPIEEPVGKTQKSGSLRVLVVEESSGRIGTVTVPDEAFRGKS